MSESIKLCFTCLRSNSKKYINVNDLDVDKISYLEKLKSCISRDLIEKERMELCLICVKELRITYKFKETVLTTQEALKKCSNSDDMNIFNIKLDSANNFEFIKHEWEDVKGIIDSKNEDFMKSELGSELDNCDDFDADENNVLCKKCKQFYSEDDCIEHECKIDTKSENARENDIAMRFVCDFCGGVFDKKWKLQKHITRNHKDTKKYICNFCNKAFKQSYHLKEHITSHTGEKNFTCSFCDKKFQRLSSVSRHLKTHNAAPGQKTKRTPYLCTICGKNFPFSNGAQRHMRIHLGIRRYECSICGRKFSQSTHLYVHMRTHTGEKPYICDTCGESFSLNAALQKHIKVRHKS